MGRLAYADDMRRTTMPMTKRKPNYTPHIKMQELR